MDQEPKTQGNNNNLTLLHKQLVKDNYAIPADYKEFESTFQNPKNAKDLYDQLTTDKYAIPEDYNSFLETFGLKKKDASDYGLPTKEVFSQMFQNISKEDLERQGYKTDAPKEFETTDLTLKSPEFKPYEEPSLTQVIGQTLSKDRIELHRPEYKKQTEARISEIDKEIAALPESKTDLTVSTINIPFAGPSIAKIPVSEEKARLLKEKDELKMAITSPDKLTYILGKGYNQSILGLSDAIINGQRRASEEWLSKYDAGTLTDVTATVLGFLLDAPMFGVGGKIGSTIGKVAAKPLVDRAMTKGIEKLIKAGIEKPLAEKLVLKGATKLSQGIISMSSSGTALGSYGFLTDALGQWAQPDANFEDIKWSNSLKRGARDYALGIGVGGLGLGASAIAEKARAIENAVARTGVQAGTQIGTLTAESALFTYGGALLDGKPLKDVTTKDFLETAAMLAMLKSTNIAQKPAEALTNIKRSLTFDPGKPGQGQFEVDIEPWELRLLDQHLEDLEHQHTYKDTMEILKDSDGWLADVLKDENIPALLKQKLLWGARGVAMPDVNLFADKIVQDGEFIDLYNKEGVLVDRRKFSTKEESDQSGIDIGLQLEDNKMQMRSAEPDVDRIKILTNLKNNGTDVHKLLIALDKPVAERTPEESKMVGDYFSMMPKPRKESEGEIYNKQQVVESLLQAIPEESRDMMRTEFTSIDKDQFNAMAEQAGFNSFGSYWTRSTITKEAGKKSEAIKEEPLTINDKTFTDKSELFKYLDETATQKNGAIKEGWMDTKEIPNTPTLKAINEWEKTKTHPEQVKTKSTHTTESPKQKIRRMRSSMFKKGSRSYKAVNETAGNFEDSVMQFFIAGGKISKQDFIDNSGWGEADIRKAGLGFLLSKNGQKLDVFHEALENSFGMEEKGPMDMINAIVDVVKNNPTRGKMLEAFEKRHKIEQPFEPTEEEITKQENDEKFAEIIKKNGGLNGKAMDEAAEAGLISKDELKDFKQELENEYTEQEQSAREWAEEEARIAAEYEGSSENVSTGEKPGEGEEKPAEVKTETKSNEEPVKQPNPPVSTKGENIVPGSTEKGKEPVTPEGKEKPIRTSDASKQKQIDAIDKEYDEKIADAQKELEGMTEEKRNKVIRDAEAEVNRRNTIFGDAEAKESDLIKPEDQGFEVSRKPIEEAVKKFDERKVELTKQVDALNKERESKIGEVLKQQTLGFEEAPKEVKATKTGIEYKGKTYTDIEQVQDDYVAGKLTLREQNELLEKVRKFEEKPEGFAQSSRAKADKKYRNEPRAESPEELAWDEPLPMSMNEDPSYKASDLNNAMSLRNMGRNLVKNIGKTEGEQVRTGLIKRFMRKAAGIFNPHSGVIRVKNISDVRVLAHEIGHSLDQFVFDIRGVIGYRQRIEGDRYADITAASKINGVKFRNKTYKTEQKIDEALKAGQINQARASILKGKLAPQIKARDNRLEGLKAKYGEDLVAGVLQRQEFKQELTGYLAYVGYPSDKRTEAIAEFVKDYVVNPDQVKQVTPKFYAWFEKLIENAPEIKNALIQARGDWNRYDAQDPRMKVLTLFSETEKNPSFIDGIIKLDKDKILYSWVNHLQYMKNLSDDWRKIIGPQAPSYKDPYYSAKTMMGIDGRAQQWLLNNPYSRKGNDVVLNKNIEGLMSVLKPIIGTPKDMDFRGYLLAKDSMESHQQGHPEQAAMPSELAKTSIKLWEEQYGVQQLWDFQSKIQKYNEALLDFYVESGKMSSEDVALIKSRHQYYVPLKRMFDEYEVGGGKGMSKEILAASEKAVWSRHGSMKAIKDIYQSMIENTYHILAAGERNILLTNVKDAFMDIQKYNRSKKIDTSIIEEIPPNTIKAYFDVETGEMRYTVTKEKPRSGRIMSVWENGKVHYYDVAPEYYDPIFQQEPKVSELFRKLSLPSRWLQAGAVVYDPTFPIRNIVRDQQSGFFYSKHGYLPTDFIKGLSSFIGKDDYYQRWLASGGDQSFLISADQMMEKDYAKKKIGRTLQRKWETYRRNPLAAFQDLSRASEIGTRLGAFKNAYKKTNDVWKAAVESRDVSADYGMHGARVRAVLGMYPFLNANIQHARMMTETFKNPVKLFMKGMAITAPALANWLLNNQDDESKKLYQSLPTWRRTMMYNIRIPGTDHFLPLPKGFYGVMFGSSIEALMDHTIGDDDRVAKELPRELFQQFSPIGEITEFVPFIIRPKVEMWANKKGYTGKPIISESMKLLKPSEQYYNSTPEIYKKIGEALNWSPVKIDHYIRSYTGGAGMGAVNILDESLQLIGLVDKKPEDTFTVLSRMPVFKALLTEKPIGIYSGYISDFYETLDKVEKLNATFNNLVKTENYDKLDKLMSDPENQRMYSFYEGNSTAIANFRSALTWIRDASYAVMKDDLLTNKEKQAEIDRMNRIVQESGVRFKEAYEKGDFFDYGKGMDDIITNMKAEKKDVRSDMQQQESIYNPYWIQLRKQNKDVYDRLREFGGFKAIEQTRTINQGNGQVNLELEDVRRFNETVVKRYGENVKNMIGTNKTSYEGYQKVTNPEKPEETQLEQLLDSAWEMALTQTKNDFVVQQMTKTK